MVPMQGLQKNFIKMDAHNNLNNNLNDDIVQNIIYAFTGIQGDYLKKDVITNKFKLDMKAKSLNVTQAGMLLRLSELGYVLHIVA